MYSIYDKAGERIRKLREINRYTREEFAEIADISPKFLYEIEVGKKGFSADTLYRIARGLSVTCDYIASGENKAGYGGAMLTGLDLFNGSQMNDLEKLLIIVYELATKFDER